MSALTIKIPDHTMEPTTIMVEERRPSSRLRSPEGFSANKTDGSGVIALFLFNFRRVKLRYKTQSVNGFPRFFQKF
jgi:hypothetical protein